jgi:hypothetical protein
VHKLLLLLLLLMLLIRATFVVFKLLIRSISKPALTFT